MQFYMPVKVYEEENCVENHKKELAQCGKKALIMTGKQSAKKNGALADVRTALEEEGISWILFDEVEENPSVDTVMKAREAGLRGQADFVVGIGGGSAMDAAKAAALMICHREKDAAYLYEKGADSAAFPVVAIPTTCGTGSEVTAVSVLTRRDRGTKGSIPHRIFPSLALLDAKYLQAAPESVLCNTAVDAFAHLAESYINTNATDFSRMCVAAGLQMWKKSRDVLTGERQPEKEDYRNLLNASMMAGMAICHTGTSLPHGLSYPLTCELNLPHGVAVGYFLGGYLREADEADSRYVLETAGFSDAEEFEAFFEKICRCGEIPESLLRKTTEELLKNEAKLKNCPYSVDEKVLKRIAKIN